MGHRYFTRHRPPSFACVPTGWTLVERGTGGFFPKRGDLPEGKTVFGVIEYPEPLPAQDLATFELEPVVADPGDLDIAGYEVVATAAVDEGRLVVLTNNSDCYLLVHQPDTDSPAARRLGRFDYDDATGYTFRSAFGLALDALKSNALRLIAEN